MFLVILPAEHNVILYFSSVSWGRAVTHCLALLLRPLFAAAAVLFHGITLLPRLSAAVRPLASAAALGSRAGRVSGTLPGTYLFLHSHGKD